MLAANLRCQHDCICRIGRESPIHSGNGKALLARRPVRAIRRRRCGPLCGYLRTFPGIYPVRGFLPGHFLGAADLAGRAVLAASEPAGAPVGAAVAVARRRGATPSSWGIYVASRTAGLPFGPDLHHAESVGALDVVSCVLEFLLIAGCAALLWRPSLADRPVRRRGGLAAIAAAAAVPVLVIAATTAVMTPGWAGPEGPAGMAAMRTGSSSGSTSVSAAAGMGDMGTTDGQPDMKMYGSTAPHRGAGHCRRPAGHADRREPGQVPERPGGARGGLHLRAAHQRRGAPAVRR